ncbi:hypothetical protein B0H14DRAFT_2703212 [Mycena olivaceomarginata]|nr:hypothetical protein B0H14DRAFT_2703212 [Mycena olivaceomarginata]
MPYNPNYLQGSAMAALTWVVYDVCLRLDREIVSVWRSSWSLSKILFLFSRYHTILSLGCAVGTKHFVLPLVVSFNGKPPPPGSFGPCIANLPYIGLTEVFSILAGELLILIRINTVYGWSRKIVALTLFLFSGTDHRSSSAHYIGLVTTVISLLGDSGGLFGSRNILICGPDGANVPDVNLASELTSMAVACVYIGLVIHKALDVLQDIEAADGRPGAHRVGLVAYFKSSRITLPILHRCLRDAALYFVVVFVVLLVNLILVVSHNRFAQLGSAWLLATYSVAVRSLPSMRTTRRPVLTSSQSTRIFINLKELTLPANNYNGVTWSQFQQDSALELQLRSGLRTRTSQDRRSMHNVDTRTYLP